MAHPVPHVVGIYEDLKDKVVVVSGAGTGIGEATALAFAKNGSRLVLLGRRLEPLQQVAAAAKALGAPEAIGISTDVSKEEQVAAAAREVGERFGGADVVVNNAGGGGKEFKSVVDIDVEDWHDVFELNFWSAVYTQKHFVPHMIEQGKGAIVHVSSMVSKQARLKTGAYGPAKAALNYLGMLQALELAEFGIRANVAVPAGFATPMLLQAQAAGQTIPDRSKGDIDAFMSKYPIGRLGDPDEMAATILFLASDASAFITGQAIQVDGGIGVL